MIRGTLKLLVGCTVRKQEHLEDCQVCCKLIFVSLDIDEPHLVISTEDYFN
ncbi:MAG: CPXCG motif-containing cysteine-rich protein [Proteobacteria bacterium]|nr:CPXCG motif-containing cysteine-rich protein [Pseudomonadota bacterium]